MDDFEEINYYPLAVTPPYQLSRGDVDYLAFFSFFNFFFFEIVASEAIISSIFGDGDGLLFLVVATDSFGSFVGSLSSLASSLFSTMTSFSFSIYVLVLFYSCLSSIASRSFDCLINLTLIDFFFLYDLIEI